MPVKVLIYDDNPHLRQSLQTLLQWKNEFTVEAAMPDATTVLTDLETFQPDIIIMDIDMPQINGVASVKRIREKGFETPVIMLTVFEDNDNIINAICAGASGYLLKKDITNISIAINDVLNGGAPMTAAIAKKVLQLFPQRHSSKTELPNKITKREKEILDLLIQGKSFKMIASLLSISLDTVRTHVKNIYRKLQVNCVTEAVYKATKLK